jgi:AcrR family transcriptional regulator
MPILPVGDCTIVMQKESRKVREFRRREQEILDTSLRLFLEQGEDSVTVEMIADEVGIGKGTIYKHFKSKAEIYLRLMLDYERDLASLLHSESIERDREALSRDYFAFRMSDPERYRLFDRLEEKLVKSNQLPELVEELHSIRASNFNHLTGVIQERIDDGKLENVPAYFHYCAAWALVHGAMAMYHSPFWQEVIEDKEGYMQFLMDIGVRMGNKSKRKKELESAEAQQPGE